jgi:hypothetical protein
MIETIITSWSRLPLEAPESGFTTTPRSSVSKKAIYNNSPIIVNGLG